MKIPFLITNRQNMVSQLLRRTFDICSKYGLLTYLLAAQSQMWSLTIHGLRWRLADGQATFTIAFQIR